MIMGSSSFSEEKISSWTEWKTYSFQGIQAKVSAPVLVSRGVGYLWFPVLVCLDKDNLVAVMQNRADACTDPDKTTALVARSRNGGLHWTEASPGYYGQCPLRQADGSYLLLPFYTARNPEGLIGYCQRMVVSKDDMEWIRTGVKVSGWARPDGDNFQNVGMAGFVFTGQTVDLRDGGYLATMYGYFKGTKRYSLVAVMSNDGRNWKVRSVIADENCKLQGQEGSCEAAVARLEDGRLMCVFRIASGVPYGQCWSSDEGRTWTEPIGMSGPHSVQPSLAVIKNGMVVLSGGRPGIYLWINPDGRGKDWQQIDVMAHHNAYQVKEPVKSTTSYTEVVALDETTLLMIYDRLHVPCESPETNSVWVVRITVSVS